MNQNQTNYQKGKQICEELFLRTGDIKYYMMAKSFEEFQK